jgi:hypothetical protein
MQEIRQQSKVGFLTDRRHSTSAEDIGDEDIGIDTEESYCVIAVVLVPNEWGLYVLSVTRKGK